jgi:hypothetical protein
LPDHRNSTAMFRLVLNESDKKWLQEKYPGLTINRENGIQVMSGEFYFDALYQEERITDTYEIRIELRSSALSDLPKVSETASRIKKVSEDRNIPLADLHTYEDGTTCLCVRLAEPGYFPDGFSFQTFMEELVVPFFYAQSYFERSGNWPWETYSHGILGWLEWYFDQEVITPEITGEFMTKLKSTYGWKILRDELIKDHGIRGHHLCICGSTKRYRNCHNKVFRGLWKLHQHIREFGIAI